MTAFLSSVMRCSVSFIHSDPSRYRYLFALYYSLSCYLWLVLSCTYAVPLVVLLSCTYAVLLIVLLFLSCVVVVAHASFVWLFVCEYTASSILLHTDIIGLM